MTATILNLGDYRKPRATLLSVECYFTTRKGEAKNETFRFRVASTTKVDRTLVTALINSMPEIHDLRVRGFFLSQILWTNTRV